MNSKRNIFMKLPLTITKKAFRISAIVAILSISITSCSSSSHVCDAYTLQDRIDKIEQIKANDFVSNYN
jgi:cell division protein FtsL